MHALLKNHSVLYMEKEEHVQMNISEYLKAFFREVHTAVDGMEGWKKYLELMPSAVLLDIDLPRLDGLTVAKRIRERDKETSIVIISALTDTSKLLEAAELKLLKYLVKPVATAALKEMLHGLALELMGNPKRYMCLGEGFGWDLRKEYLLHYGVEVPLTTKERQMLALLARHRQQPVCFEEIMAHVWADEIDREISLNCIKNIISNLRKKLPLNVIKSVYGKGYMLR